MNGSEHDAPASAVAPPPATPPPQPAGHAPAPRWDHRAAAVDDPRRKSPVLACFLSLMPGLGQVYVGYYRLGFIHALVVASVVALLASETVMPLAPLLGIFLGFFFLYNLVDAGRRAALYNQVLLGIEGVKPPKDIDLGGLGGSLVGGAVLMGIGLILLSNTAFDVSLEWLEHWWPVAPILFGAYLFGRGVQDRRKADGRD